jgi:hypothetical protein
MAASFLLLLLSASHPQDPAAPDVAAPSTAEPGLGAPSAAGQSSAQRAVTLTCASKAGERTQCSADTSKGVGLLRSTGPAPCLLGGTRGYDQSSAWVADGCTAEFGTPAEEPKTTKPTPLSHVPNVGFLLFDGDKGQIYFRLFSYGRYLNQRNLEESYLDAFGNTQPTRQPRDALLIGEVI